MLGSSLIGCGFSFSPSLMFANIWIDVPLIYFLSTLRKSKIIRMMSVMFLWVRNTSGKDSERRTNPWRELVTTNLLGHVKSVNKWSNPFVKSSTTKSLSWYSDIVENKRTVACWWFGSSEPIILATESVMTSITFRSHTLAKVSRAIIAEALKPYSSYSFFFKIRRHFMIEGRSSYATVWRKFYYF